MCRGKQGNFNSPCCLAFLVDVGYSEPANDITHLSQGFNWCAVQTGDVEKTGRCSTTRNGNGRKRAETKNPEYEKNDYGGNDQPLEHKL